MQQHYLRKWYVNLHILTHGYLVYSYPHPYKCPYPCSHTHRCKEKDMSCEDFREVVDWEYYKERLGR
ncbi:hypothetical protein EON63_21690 [archaeon]|nr:MAG: hypothetical protein EON63_21690 [archaeon]